MFGHSILLGSNGTFKMNINSHLKLDSKLNSRNLKRKKKGKKKHKKEKSFYLCWTQETEFGPLGQSTARPCHLFSRIDHRCGGPTRRSPATARAL